MQMDDDIEAMRVRQFLTESTAALLAQSAQSAPPEPPESFEPLEPPESSSLPVSPPELSFDFVNTDLDVGDWGGDTIPDVPLEPAAPESPLVAPESAPAPDQKNEEDNNQDGHQGDDQGDGQGSSAKAEPDHQTRIEVALPTLPAHRRIEYEDVHSDIIEVVTDAVVQSRGQPSYLVEFTDARQELLPLSQLSSLENGREALELFTNGMTMGRKRKHASDDGWDSDSGLDPMDIDEDEDEEISVHRAAGLRARNLRPRAASARASFDRESSDDSAEKPNRVPERNLRQREKPKIQQTLSFLDDRDELAEEPQPPSDVDHDGDFQPVVSDLAIRKVFKRKNPRHARRAKAQSTKRPLLGRRGSNDSDIEFEQPRRSGRSNKNTKYMVDDALMDEDSFYVIDDKGPGVPRAVLVRETFQTLPADSTFPAIHLPTCHTCGGSKQRGQIVNCQGCSLSYHKQCLGPRNGREHLATKIGEDSFVLQCRFCLDTYLKKGKKENTARPPKQSLCQGCRQPGKACAAFSEFKTARQEEKMREENNGTDPITNAPSALLHNQDIILLRCITCHRGWHRNHLPSLGDRSIDTDVEAEHIKDFMVDWQCNECSTSQQKIHRLVAWRPSPQAPQKASDSPAFQEVSEDDKEYLVKWADLSYRHCTWMPGAWVFGVSAPAMMFTFAKHASQQDLLQVSTENAVPEDFLKADVIFDAKLGPGAPRSSSRDGDVANIAHVSKIFVKFQGLGYNDVVWDAPPALDEPVYRTAFEDAYMEYLGGKYFASESQYKIQERVKSFKNSDFEPVESQPEGLKRGKLMGYQMEGLNWLLGNYHDNRSVVLADEMGLGKTIQVISLVTSLVQDSPRAWPFLIVVPNATCPNWRREFKQWAPGLRVVTYHGGRESQELAYQYELFPRGCADMKAHVVIMSYDSAQDPKTKVLFKSVRWTGLVVDEGQRLKNDQNLLYLALQSMKIPFRLLLTGTPLQNNKRELFNLLQFIDDKQNAASLDQEYEVLDKETLPKLHDKIRPFFLRRTKLGVLKFLPPMVQIILPVTMTVIQEKLSKSIMAKNPQLIKAIFANSKLVQKDRSSLNNILMQLRKCLCHPFMYSDAIEERHHDPSVLYQNLVAASAKLLLFEVLLPKLRERGHRVLIFSQFLQQLDILEDFLSGLGLQYRRLDGSISSLEKQKRIDAFNAPDSPLFAFLLSTRAGGVGINLATADTVIIMDPDFNPHQDIQALSRAHRIGQKKKVTCFQLVTKDSIEERIMQVGRKKMALDHALIESMDDDQLVGDDLESIIKHGAKALFDESFQKSSIHYDEAAVGELLDRAEAEQTKTDENGSGEQQFPQAQVWAKDKSGFSEGLDTAEDQAPEPINSSVWDRILAEREEEARRQAEAEKEVLGRGGRRRTAINYKTVGVLEQDGRLPEGLEPDTSDGSDEFAGANSSEELDDDDPADKGNEEWKDAIRNGKKAAAVAAATAAAAQGPGQGQRQGQGQAATVRPSKIRGRRSTAEAKGTPDAGGNADQGGTPQAQTRQSSTRQGNTSRQLAPQGEHVPNGTVAQNDASRNTAANPGNLRPNGQPPVAYAQPNGNAAWQGNVAGAGTSSLHHAAATQRRQQQQHVLAAANGLPPGHENNPTWIGPGPPPPVRPPGPNMTPVRPSAPGGISEAQLRLAIDEMRRSRSDPDKLAALLSQLQWLGVQGSQLAEAQRAAMLPQGYPQGQQQRGHGHGSKTSPWYSVQAQQQWQQGQIPQQNQRHLQPQQQQRSPYFPQHNQFQPLQRGYFQHPSQHRPPGHNVPQ